MGFHTRADFVQCPDLTPSHLLKKEPKMLYFAKMITLIFLIFMAPFSFAMHSTPEPVPPEKVEGPILETKDIKIGTEVFFQACYADPQKYFKLPKSREGVIREVANKVVKISKTEFGRPFHSLAESKIEISGTQFNAKLINFRDLQVVDNTGKILYSRHIAGATSLYEIYHNGKVVAWGIGWHNKCGQYYNNTDFTALRVIAPFRNGINGETLGAFDFEYYVELNQNSQLPILYALNSVGAGADAYHYYLPSFYVLDPEFEGGIKKVNTYEELKKLNANINYLSPFLQFRYLTSIGEYNEALELLERDGEKFAENMSKEYPGAIIEQSYVSMWNVCKDNNEYKREDSTKMRLMNRIKGCFIGNPDSQTLSKYLFSDIYGLPFNEEAEVQ